MQQLELESLNDWCHNNHHSPRSILCQDHGINSNMYSMSVKWLLGSTSLVAPEYVALCSSFSWEWRCLAPPVVISLIPHPISQRIHKFGSFLRHLAACIRTLITLWLFGFQIHLRKKFPLIIYLCKFQFFTINNYTFADSQSLLKHPSPYYSIIYSRRVSPFPCA